MMDFLEKLDKIQILLMSGISSALVTHLFYRFKLKSEQRIRFQNLIGDRIQSSLIELRKLTAEASVIERYDIIFPEEFDETYTDVLEGTIYPAVMHDHESLWKFIDKVDTSWKKYGDTLDCETALHLWYASRYFHQLIIYITENNYQEYLPELGTVFIFDIQKWQLSFDKVLIKRINKPINKLEFHQGIKWKIKRRKFIRRFWNRSFLIRIMNDDKGKDMKLVWDFLDHLNDIQTNHDKERAN